MRFEPPKSIRPHWNYFLALEKDLERTSRYVEFCNKNLDTYSIEIAHLLLSSASEVDTIAKCICTILNPTAKAQKIDEYRKVIKAAEAAEESQRCGDVFGAKDKTKLLPDSPKHSLSNIKIYIPRYSVVCTPWKSWADDKTPEWWTHYNNVKHERNKHFDKATLRNALNALAGLLAVNYFYCRVELCRDKMPYLYEYHGKVVTKYLEPNSTVMTFESTYYSDPIASLGSYVSGVAEDVNRLFGQMDDLRD